MPTSQAFFPTAKRVLKLSLPMAGSRFIQMLTGFIAILMVAHLGKSELAASALINTIQGLVIVTFIAILFATGVIAGEKYGAKEYSAIGALWQQGSVLAVILSIPMIVIYLLLDKVLLFLHQPVILIPYIQQYFYASIWMVVPLMLLIVAQQIFYGVLKQRIVIIIDCINLISFIGIAYVFIFGKWFVPRYGIVGMAYAYAIQDFLSLVMLVGCLYWRKDFKKYDLFCRHSHKGWIYLKQLFVVGWPMCVHFGGEMSAFTFRTIMTGWLGLSALASIQIIDQFFILFIVPIFAVSEAAGILVSHEVGAKQYHNIRRMGNIAMGIVMLMVVLVALLFLLTPHWLASFYFSAKTLENQQLLHSITILFVILAITFVLNSFRDIATGALRGLFDTRYPMLISVLTMWGVMIPFAYLFGFFIKGGVIGLRASSLIALLLGAVLIWRRWIKQTNEYKNLKMS